MPHYLRVEIENCIRALICSQSLLCKGVFYKMGDYEAEQKRLQKIWDEIMSDEGDCNEFDNGSSSDEYVPDADTSSSSSSSDVSDTPQTSVVGCKHQEPRPSTSRAQSDSDEEVIDTVNQAIESVITQHAVSTDDDEARVDEIIWRQVDKTSLKHFPFTVNDTGIKVNLYEEFINSSVYDCYKLFVTDDIIQFMVHETNRYAEQVLKKGIKPRSRLKNWTPVTMEELEKFLGILLWMGLVQQPKLRNYWSQTCLYSNEISKTMSRNRFENILKMWHFSNNEDDSFQNDRLRKLTPLVQKLISRFQAVVTAGQEVCIDETLVPFRGRLRFRQYIKNKRHKFGIKLYKLCTEGGYTYNMRVYCGNDGGGSGLSSSNVVLDLMRGLLGEGRILYTDNYYTSVSLATDLLKQNTHLVGTLRGNRKLNPKEVINKKLKRKEVVAQESGTGIIVLKWKDKRDVTMLTTIHGATKRTVCSRGKDIEKPEVVWDYNKSKAFIDLSDQLKSYSHCLRRGTKWYRKLAVELLLGTALVNAFLVYKEVTQNKLQVTNFREQLALALMKRDAKIHKNNDNIEENHALVEQRNRLRCVACYANMKNEKGRLEAQNRTVRTKWHCVGCKKYYCVPCFFQAHNVTLK